MAPHHSIKEILQEIPNALLAGYSVPQRLFSDLNFSVTKENKLGALTDAWRPNHYERPLALVLLLRLRSA